MVLIYSVTTAYKLFYCYINNIYILRPVKNLFLTVGCVVQNLKTIVLAYVIFWHFRIRILVSYVTKIIIEIRHKSRENEAYVDMIFNHICREVMNFYYDQWIFT
jgi:hypothetical protein